MYPGHVTFTSEDVVYPEDKQLQRMLFMLLCYCEDPIDKLFSNLGEKLLFSLINNCLYQADRPRLQNY